MKIIVAGAGATGTLFAGLLAKCGENVFLLDKDGVASASVKNAGLKYEGTGGLVRIPIDAGTKLTNHTAADLVMICVKPTETAMIADIAADAVGPRTAVLSMQEGIGDIPKLIERFGAERVFAGATGLIASLIAPGHVLHSGWGETFIAPAAADQLPKAATIASHFTKVGLKTSAHPDLNALIWTRAVIQSGFYALTTLLQMRNGKVQDLKEASELMEILVEESERVVRVAGISLITPDPVAEVRRLIGMTAEYNSPMLQAFYRGRASEIEGINGAIVELAERHGTVAPHNKVMYLLVKAAEQIREET